MNKLAFYVAGAGGGAITSVIELCKDTNNATVVRLGGVLGKFFLTGGNVYLSPTSWAIIMIILVSVFGFTTYHSKKRRGNHNKAALPGKERSPTAPAFPASSSRSGRRSTAP